MGLYLESVACDTTDHTHTEQGSLSKGAWFDAHAAAVVATLSAHNAIITHAGGHLIVTIREEGESDADFAGRSMSVIEPEG